MKSNGFGVGVVILILAVAIFAQTGEKRESRTAERELLKLEQEWTNADLRMDWATMDRILADDYVLTDCDGRVYTKDQCQAFYDPSEGKVLALVTDDLKVRVFGDAAVVTLRAKIRETYQGQETSNTVRITNTWIKKAGRWRCVATHSSRIAGEK